MSNTIKSAVVGPMPKGLFDSMPKVTATFEDGTSKVLFEFYPDEISFAPEEFVGLTEEEACALKGQKDHDNNIQSAIQKQRDTCDDKTVPMEDWVMVTKVRKHLAAGKPRKAAHYVALRLGEFSSSLSTWAQAYMRTTPLKSTQSQVLYQDEKGAWRAFDFVRPAK